MRYQVRLTGSTTKGYYSERNHVSLTLEGRLSPESRRKLWELIGK